jgi:ribonuclease R
VPVEPSAIIDFLRSAAGRPLKAKELARGLDVATEDYAGFKALIARMEEEGLLYRVQRQRYAVPEKINLVVGRFQAIRGGAGFVVPDEGDGDVYVAADAVASAVDGDRVIVRVERRRRGPRVEGSVIRVLERARRTVVGVFHPIRNAAFVTPEDRKLTRDIFLPGGQDVRAAAGDIVVVRVTDWGSDTRGPSGEVERVLGSLGDPGVDVLAIAYGHELPLEFPAVVSAEAERLRERGVRDVDLDGREDFRDRLVFTIDPADARDHDDALSIEKAGNGAFHVGIHIADVSHYVEAGSPLDTEALARGTSVYLVDRVIPMLPHALSGDLCSLVPDTDRLTLSVLVTLDEDGSVRAHRLARSVIRSRHRLSYDQAQAALDGATAIDAETDAALHALVGLSRALRARREARGSLDFDLPEARVILNSAGEPTDIQRVLRLESHRLIEDFMLLANETVATRASNARVPFVYRVHEAPDESRLEQLADFVATLGYRVPGGGRPGGRDLQRLLAQARGRPEENLVSTVVLRSMKQAKYSAENVGHFGLAARHYTHFTSPIRRYPDLIVHRLCKQLFLDDERIGTGEASALPWIARQSSERERVAVDAERDSVDLKKVEFMQRHLGDEFDGTISNVTAFGLFVLLDAFFVEGLVHVSSLDDDYYVYVEEQFTLVGENRRRRFRLGDRVRVRVAAVDLEQRKIDFVLLEGGSAAPGGRRGGARRESGQQRERRPRGRRRRG